ncbi:MAG: GNAT family N-acetyltransferase [Candidatus Margulisbacteria bacterium]|nr:GNAT family N-acetyltransferase [Candidatus Margulisiibacteriota bacterium]
MNKQTDLTFREKPKAADVANIRRIVDSTKFFNEEELGIAVELIEERLQKGKVSGYLFLFAEIAQKVVGYVCYGPIHGTVMSYDLYWIVVDNNYRSLGIGKELMLRAEKLMKEQGGGRVYVETSSREQYLPTRTFYLSCNYYLEAQLKDFYGPNDDKALFVKELL